MSRFKGAWTSLDFDKEYLFGFETLVIATSGTLSMHNQHKFIFYSQAKTGFHNFISIFLNISKYFQTLLTWTHLEKK